MGPIGTGGLSALPWTALPMSIGMSHMSSVSRLICPASEVSRSGLAGGGGRSFFSSSSVTLERLKIPPIFPSLVAFASSLDLDGQTR